MTRSASEASAGTGHGGPVTVGRRLGFVGGTGPLGRGLGLRLAMAGYDVMLGSRSADRGRQAAAESSAPMMGADNVTVCRNADVVFITVPFEGQAAALPELADAVDGKIVVSTVVPMGFDPDGPYPLAVAEGSAAEQCQALLPAARVVSGFQSVPAPQLLKPDVVVEMDVPLLSDDYEAAGVVADLCADVKSLQGFFAGPLRLSSTVEALTPLIISINKRYKAHAGVRFVGLSHS